MDDVHGVADTIETGERTRRDGDAVALDSRENREVATGGIINCVRELEGATASITGFGNEFLEIVSGTEPAFAGTHDDTDLLGVIFSDRKVCILEGAHAGHGLELSQIVELAVEGHLDAEFLVVVVRDSRANGSGFRELTVLDGVKENFLAVTDRAYNANTCHSNLLILSDLALHIARLLAEHNTCVRAAESDVVAHDAFEFLGTRGVLHVVHCANLSLEGFGIFGRVMERRQNGIRRESLDAEHGFDCTGGAEAVARHYLGRTDTQGRIFFVEELVECIDFCIVVLARTRTMSVQVTDVRLLDARIPDSAVHRFEEADAIFARSRNVVSVACDACAENFAITLGVTLFGMFQRFDNHDAGTFTEGDAVAVVKRRAAVFVQSMERKEA